MDDWSADLDSIEPVLDEALTEDFAAGNSIALTFATGESDLLGFLERTRRLAGEVY